LRGRGRLGIGVDDREVGADFDGRSFGDQDSRDDPAGRRRDLGVDLVRRHLAQRLVLLDPLAFANRPALEGSLDHALAHLRHADGDRHG